MRCIGYKRVSTDLQKSEGYSLESQEAAIRQRAHSLGYSDDEIAWIEDTISGDLPDRPGILEMRYLLGQGSIGHVISFDTDRLSRDMFIFMDILRLIRDAGAVAVFEQTKTDNSPTGQALLLIKGVISQMDKQNILDNTNRGRRQKALNKEFTQGKLAYAYRFADDRKKTIAIDEEKAPLIREIFAWAAQGDSSVVIARRLNERGIPSPRGKEWVNRSINYLLRNPVYKGDLIIQRWETKGVAKNKNLPKGRKVKRTFKPEDQWVHIDVPPIVPEEIWQAAFLNLDGTAKRLAASPNKPRYPFLLTSLLRCDNCKQAISGTAHLDKAHGKFYKAYYRCNSWKKQGRIGDGKCGLPFGKARVLDAFVWTQVMNWVTDPKTYQAQLKAQLTPPKDTTDRESMKRELDETKKRLDRIKRILMDTDFSLADYAQEVRQLKNRKEALERQLKAPARGDVPDVKTLRRMLPSASEDFEAWPIEKKRKLVRFFIHEILVKDSGDPKDPWDLEFLLKLPPSKPAPVES